MNPQEQAMGLLKELAEHAGDLCWHQDHLGKEATKRDPSARAYTGDAEGWRVLVVSFSIEDQGHPKGARGYDGTVVRSAPPVVVRLTRELAEKLFKLAEAQPTPAELAKAATTVRLAKAGNIEAFPERLRLELLRAFGPETTLTHEGLRVLVRLPNGHVIPIQF